MTGCSFLTPRLAFLAEFLEGGERRAHIADRIAGGRGQRLGIALVAVGRMALLDDRVHLVDQPLDLLGVLERPSAQKSQMRCEARGM